MCYRGKCLMCIPVEHGCLVVAILSAIVTCLSLLASIILGLLTVAGVFIATSQAREHRYDSFNEPDVEAAVAVGGVALSVITILTGIPSLVAFIFSVLLCNGICKRRPGQVKAYFIYGVTITVLGVLAAVGYFISNVGGDVGAASPGVYTLLACVIYSMYLVLVHQTYHKLLEDAMFKDHVRLVEN